MRSRPVAAAVIAAVVGAAAVVALAARGGRGVPFPDAAAIRDHGFAVWPKDNAQQAAEAYEEHSDDQPWRLSARATVIRFGEEHLGYEKAEVIEDQTEVGETSGEVWVTAEGFFLTNIVDVLKAGECWFVTRAEFREGEQPTVFFSHRNGVTSVHLETSGHAEVGFGHDVIRIERHARRRLSWRLPDGLESEGHYIAGKGEAVAAGPLPPPPVPRAGDIVLPPGARSFWSEIEPSERRRACREQPRAQKRARGTINEVLRSEVAAAMPSGPYPAVLHPGPDGRIGRRVELHQRSNRRWRLIVDDVHLAVRLERVEQSCWPVRSITALNRSPVLERVWVSRDSFTIAMDWGEANRAKISLRYGGTRGARAGGGELHRTPGLLTFDLADDFDPPHRVRRVAARLPLRGPLPPESLSQRDGPAAAATGARQHSQ